MGTAVIGTAEPLVGIDEAWLPAREGAEVLAGWSVALDADTVAVGAVVDGEALSDASAGGVYVFARDRSGWSRQSRLLMLPGVPTGRFGHAVAIDGDQIVVGAPEADGADYRAGLAYLYARKDRTWNPQTWFFAPFGRMGDAFGWAVAVDGDTLVIAAPFEDVGDLPDVGSVYVFERGGSIWLLHQKLTPASPRSSQYFGFALDIAVDTMVVGAPGRAEARDFSGSAHVFVRDGLTWRSSQVLSADTRTFGFDVCLADDRLAVGAPGDGHAGPRSGAAFLYERADDQWLMSQRLEAADAKAGDHFGFAVALDRDRLVVGAPADSDDGPNAGSVSLFAFEGDSWSEQSEVQLSFPVADAHLGHAVALGGDVAIAGIPYASSDDGTGAHVFRLGLGQGASCTDTTQCATQHCVDGICCESECDKGAAPCLGCAGRRTDADDGLCRPMRAGIVCRDPVCRAGVHMLAGVCDGQHGDCPVSDTEGCAPYLCGPRECRTGCENDADCTLGFRCLQDECLPAQASKKAPGCGFGTP